MKPILKWAGGKQRLLPQLVPLLPDDWKERRYVEPFMGGGAMFFHLEPKTALLADVNEGLINMYEMLVERWHDVVRPLEQFRRDHSEVVYYASRDAYNRGKNTAPLTAAMFIYLNKACFNGLWRENSKGEMNVPFGKADKVSLPSQEHLAEAYKALEHGSVRLKHQGFAETLATCGPGDFIYLDPPYDVEPGKTGHTKYSGAGFGEKEQGKLSWCLGDLHYRGVKWMMSSSDTPYIRKIYDDCGLSFTEISAPRSINSKGTGRGNVMTELVIRNY